jgi:hypothetical protein
VVTDMVTGMTAELSMTPTRVRQLRILSALKELSAGDISNDVPVASLVERLASEPDLGDVGLTDQLKVLADEGTLGLDLRLGGVVAAARLLPPAHSEIEQFEAARQSLPPRRRQLRDDYLRWLYAQIEVHDASPTPHQYLQESPTYLGIPYSEKDLEKVGEWLVTNGFIEGPAAWQYAGPLRPTLTTKGSFTVENGRLTNDPAPTNAQTFNTTVNGSANIAQASSNVQQIQNIEWKADGLRLIDAIEQAGQTLSADIAENLIEEIAAAREQIFSSFEPR